MKTLSRWLPWFFVALFGCEVLVVMLPKKDGEYHVREFGRLPVLLGGRIQPFDSVARNALLQIRSTGDLPLEIVPSWKFWHHPKKLRSSEWLLEVMTQPDVADTRPVFLIHHAELLGELKLQDKGIEKSGLRYYSFNELKPVLDEIGEQGRRAEEVKPEQQSAFQKQAAKLANAVMLYARLKYTLQPPGVDDFSQELKDFAAAIPAAQAAAKNAKGNELANPADKEAMGRVAGPFEQFSQMEQFGYAMIVPPLKTGDQWMTAGACLKSSFETDQVHPAMTYFAAMSTAMNKADPAAFNQAITDYQKWLQPRFAREVFKGRAEFYYNDVKAFLHATIIYIFALVLSLVALLTFGLLNGVSETCRKSALYLVILAGLVHTFALVFRMALEGRPPVTNLYSSAIFIGWAAMICGIIIERAYPLAIGTLVASLAGFVTLLIAHNLALGGDTMEMLRAVLDTNFWLATHVVVITLGYAATFFAGLMAIIYVFIGVFTPLLSQKISKTQSGEFVPLSAGSKMSNVGSSTSTLVANAVASASPISPRAKDLDIGKALAKMVYAVVCFATLFSFVGTVLGGIWADQSWGRFWGWDPKENGALLIVLWNAILLHARWGGLVRERGLMNMAVFGNIITSFSWFGVNMLGIGLHSYGFMDAAFKWLMLFIGSQVAIILLGLLPLSYWRSMRARAAATKAAPSVRTPVPEPAA